MASAIAICSCTRAARSLAPLIEATKLEVVIDRMFLFVEAKEALAYLETGRAKGKVVLVMR
jgi:NADPH:quinone reductase-like Zn-dependent oxidoreductase